MALPPLTPEAREQARLRAAAARQARAEVRARIAAGQMTVIEAIERAKSAGSEDDFELAALAKMRITALLEAVPGIGPVRSRDLLERLGIAESRRLRGLGPHQVAALREEFA